MRNAITVAQLAEVLDAAESGDIEEMFIVYRCRDGSYDSAYHTDDMGDMLLQVRTEIIKAQNDAINALRERVKH